MRLDLARKPQRVLRPLPDSLTGPECIRTRSHAPGAQLKGVNVRGNCLGERRTDRALSRKCRAPKQIAALAVLIACAFASVLSLVANADATASHRHPRSYSITDLGTLGGPAALPPRSTTVARSWAHPA